MKVKNYNEVVKLINESNDIYKRLKPEVIKALDYKIEQFKQYEPIELQWEKAPSTASIDRLGTDLYSKDITISIITKNEILLDPTKTKDKQKLYYWNQLKKIDKYGENHLRIMGISKADFYR